MFKVKAVVTAVLSLSLVASAYAGGAAGGGASEVTQVMNNGELIASVSKQSQIVAGQIRDYTVQINGYATALQNMKNLPVAVVGAALKPYKDTLKTLGELGVAVNDVYTSSDKAFTTLQKRREEMRNLNMNPSEYLNAEALLAYSKGGVYKEQVDRDIAAFKKAEEKSKVLAGMESQIAAVGGNVEGLQILAQQNQMMAGELMEMNAQIREKALQDNITKQQQQLLAKEMLERRQKDLAAIKLENEATQKALTNGTVSTEERRRKMFGGS